MNKNILSEGLVNVNNLGEGLVLKKQADLFTCQFGEKILVVKARKNLKDDGIFVGDRVFLDDAGAICKIKKRKNLLVRPPLANIDRMFIVIAPVPKPDLYMVDKLLVFCEINSIQPILCINKSDLDKKLCEKIEKMYKKLAKTVIFSTLDVSVKKLEDEIVGICALAGQSAVGKSSIINALKEDAIAKVDTFSKKIERGKQTTRTVELYSFGDENYLADTAGFSKLDERLLNITEHELKHYFSEFNEPSKHCKYTSCEHLHGNDCGVIKEVENGKIEENRYKNYQKLHQNLKNIKKY